MTIKLKHCVVVGLGPKNLKRSHNVSIDRPSLPHRLIALPPMLVSMANRKC